MAAIVYLLGALITLLCAILLLRGVFRRAHDLQHPVVRGPGNRSGRGSVAVAARDRSRRVVYPVVRPDLGEQMMNGAIDGFLLGVIATASITAGMFFLRFWRDTRDWFFLAFAASFIIEGLNRIGYLFLARPNEGASATYLVRLFAFLLILAAILKKNFGRSG